MRGRQLNGCLKRLRSDEHFAPSTARRSDNDEVPDGRIGNVSLHRGLRHRHQMYGYNVNRRPLILRGLGRRNAKHDLAERDHVLVPGRKHALRLRGRPKLDPARLSLRRHDGNRRAHRLLGFDGSGNAITRGHCSFLDRKGSDNDVLASQELN